MLTPTEWLFLAGTIIIVLLTLWPRHGLIWVWRRSRRMAQRTLIEDALKQMHHAEHQSGAIDVAKLAAALDLSRRSTQALVQRMVKRGLAQSAGGRLRLTALGHRWALQVIRAHRLLERYLADEAGVALRDLHAEADRREHSITPQQADEIEARLGYPTHDPHGDPIPSADGRLVPQAGQPLTEWPLDRRARIVHVEDEPEEVFAQIVAEGLVPGVELLVLEKDDRCLRICTGEEDHVLAAAAAANIFVEAPPAHIDSVDGAPRLSSLKPGERGEVLGLTSDGLARRRFLDLGLVPGTTVEAVMASPMGQPVAYRIRGTLIALRPEQADEILIKRAGLNGNEESPYASRDDHPGRS
jgi:DtxR family Mn-dependent transcriptional regulator